MKKFSAAVSFDFEAGDEFEAESFLMNFGWLNPDEPAIIRTSAYVDDYYEVEEAE